MTFVVIVLATVVFVWTFRWVGVLGVARLALKDARGAFRDLSNPELTDDQKEQLARIASGTLFHHAAALVFWTAAAFVPAIVTTLLFVWASWVDERDLLNALSSWQFLLIATLVPVTDWWFRPK